MSDEKKGFTVKDRRHFTAEGDVREETGSVEPEASSVLLPLPLKPGASRPGTSKPGASPDSEAVKPWASEAVASSYSEASKPGAGEPEAISAAAPQRRVGSSPTTSSRLEPQASSFRSPASRGQAGESIDFASFLFSLAAQAGALLEHSELDGAKQIIAILEMLEDKTEGRRTPDEDRVIDELLYELRLGFVEKSRAART